MHELSSVEMRFVGEMILLREESGERRWAHPSLEGVTGPRSRQRSRQV
jgi:hypothetical protein